MRILTYNHNLKKGFTLVEVLIVMGVASVGSLFVAETLYNNTTSGRRVTLRGDWSNLLGLLRVSFSDETICTSSFGKLGRTGVAPALGSYVFTSSTTSLPITKLDQIAKTGSVYTKQATLLEVGVSKDGIKATSMNLVKIASKGPLIRRVSGANVSRNAYEVRLQIQATRVVGVGSSSSTGSVAPSASPSAGATEVSDLSSGMTDLDPTMIRLTIYTDPSTDEIMECVGPSGLANCPDIDTDTDTQQYSNSIAGHFGHNHKICQIRTLNLNPMGVQPTTQIALGDPYPLSSASVTPTASSTNQAQIIYDAGTARRLSLFAPNVVISSLPDGSNTKGNINLYGGTGLTGGGTEIFGSDANGIAPLRIRTDTTGMGNNTYGRMIRLNDSGRYDMGIYSGSSGPSLFFSNRNYSTSPPTPLPAALAINGLSSGNVLINSLSDINTYIPTPTPTPTPSNPFELQVSGDFYATGALQVGPFPESSGTPRSTLLINGANFPMNTNTPYPNVSPTVIPASPGPVLRIQSATGSYAQISHSGNLYIDNFSTVTGSKITYINAYGGDGVYIGSYQKPQDVRLVGTLTLTPATSSGPPTCTAAIRGQIYSEQLGGAKDDRPQICVQNADGNYQWKGIVSAYERVCCTEIESYDNDRHPCHLECPENMKIKDITIAYGHSACNNLPTCAIPFVNPTDGNRPSRCPNQNPPTAGCIGLQQCDYTFFNDTSWCGGNCTTGACGVDTCPGHRKFGVIVGTCEY